MATNKPISQASIQELAAAIAVAINQSGGGSGRAYNPITNQASKQEDPASRVANIRTYKTAQNTNTLLRELAEVQKKSNKSMADMERMLDFNRKTLGQAINKYDDFTDAQEALVKELRAQLADKTTSNSVKALAGSIDKLEDVLAFSDAAKATAELAKAIKDSAKTGQNIEAVQDSIDELKRALPTGKSLGDVDQSLDNLDKRLQVFLSTFKGKKENGKYVFHDKNGNKRSDDEQEKITKALQVMLKKSNIAKNAGKAADEVAVAGHAAVINSNIKSMQRLDGVVAESGRRLSAWGLKVTSAAFVLDKLAAAASHLYATIKDAAATGTQRTGTEVMSREFSALLHGVSVEAVQSAQKDHAQQRSAAGRGNYDSQMYKGGSEFFKLTGDTDEALKQFANSADIIGKTGVSFKVAGQTTKALSSTFGELTMLTGMTVGELNALNAELTSGHEYRQSMAGLDEKARAGAIVNLDLMLKENTLRGVSIQQSKEMIKAQQDIANPFSPRARMKNAAQLRLLGSAQGVDVEKAAKVIDAGGAAQRRKELISSGMSEQQADAEIQEAQKQSESLGTKNSKDMAGRVTGQGLMTEAMGGKMDGLKSYFDGTFDTSAAKPNAVIGKAADDFKEGSKDFLAGTKMFAANWAANAGKSALGSAALGVAAYVAGNMVMRRFGGVKGLKSIGPVLGKLATRFGSSAASGVAAGGAATRAAGKAAAGAMGARAARRAALSASRGGITGFNRIPTIGAGSTAVGEAGGWLSSLKKLVPSFGKSGGIVPAIKTSTGIGAMFGGAADAVGSAAKGIGSAIPSGIKGLGKAALGRAGGLVTALASGLSIADHLTSNESKQDKVKGISGDVGSAGGGMGGAALGAMIGTAILPGIGTLIGGALGGIGGSMAGQWGGEAVGSGINALNGPSTPKQPVMQTPIVNTPTDSSTEEALNTVAKSSKGVDVDGTLTDQPADSSLILANAVAQMNSTLSSIFDIIKTSSAGMSESSAQNLEMQKRLHRAVKGSGVAGDSVPASQAYNAP